MKRLMLSFFSLLISYQSIANFINFTVDNQTEKTIEIFLDQKSVILDSGPTGGCSQVNNWDKIKSSLLFFKRDQASKDLSYKIGSKEKITIQIPEHIGEKIISIDKYLCIWNGPFANQTIKFCELREHSFFEKGKCLSMPFKSDKTYIITDDML